jgi:hypothetical protein
MHFLHAGVLYLGHVVCKEGLLVDQAKIAAIIYMPAITSSVKAMRATFRNTGYYSKFIRNYAKMTAPLEKLLNKDEKFVWTPVEYINPYLEVEPFSKAFLQGPLVW